MDNNDRKKELWNLVNQISEIINETSKTINQLVIRKVDVSKFKEYFNQLKNFFALVSKNINQPITNNQLNIIKAKLEHSKEDNKKLLETLKAYLEKSEKKYQEKMKAKKLDKTKPQRSKSRTKITKFAENEKIQKVIKKKPVKIENKPRGLSPSLSSPYLNRDQDSKMETMKEKYVNKIKEEEENIKQLEKELKGIKEEIFDIRTKNTEAIDWHAVKTKPIIKAANKKMTMMYLNIKEEAFDKISEFNKWSQLEHYLRKKLGKYKKLLKIEEILINIKLIES